MAQATLEHARSITSDLVRELDPLCVLLFGAVARDGCGTDVDLLIVVDDDKPHAGPGSTERLQRIVTAHSRFVAVDPFLIPARAFREGFLRGSPFLNAIVREGRQLYMKDSESQWAKDARDDLDAGRFLVTGGFHKAACYHAQQAVEKHLKGRLLGWELEKVHSIARLVALCADHGVTAELTEADIAYVDSINRGRYPGEAGLLPLGDPTEADARKAIQIAELALK